MVQQQAALVPHAPTDGAAGPYDDGTARPSDDGALRSPFAGLAERPGGAELAEHLITLEGAPAGAGDLVEVVAAWERVAAWASAQSAAAAARLARTPEMNPAWPDRVGRPSAPCLAGTELSLRLGRTVRAATRLVATGRMLSTVLTDTGDALATGLVDRAKADVFAEVLAEVPGEVALAAESLVLPEAPFLTTTQLRRRLAAAVLDADPAEAQARHAAARTRRCVTRPRALPDGMAAITATMPADAAVRLDACLQSAAEVARRQPGEVRTVDQLRADALDALAVAAWDAGHIGPCRECATSGVRMDGPGGTASGPVDTKAAEARPAAAKDAGAGPAATRAAGRGPAGTKAAAARPTVAKAVETEAAAARSADRQPAVAGAGSDGWSLVDARGGRTQVQVTVGIGTLLGLDDEPAHLGGYGPVGADVARALASDGTWRRWLVDDATGTVLDVGTRSYRPSARLARLVRARDDTCVFPTCAVPARLCELDHTVPFGDGGTTSAGNLGPLCVTHHLYKTHGRYRLEQPAAGTFVVTTPTGRVYRTRADRPPGVRAAPPTWPPDDAPPF